MIGVCNGNVFLLRTLCFSDSVVFVTRPGDTYMPKKGAFLGELTDELEDYGDGAYIKEFVCGGPKNYGFRVQRSNGRTETKVKIRGFTLNYHASSKLNFNTLKKKVLGNFSLLRHHIVTLRESLKLHSET